MIKDFAKVEEVEKITFGNKYRYNATSGNEVSPTKYSEMGFSNKSHYSQKKETEFKNLIKHRENGESQNIFKSGSPIIEKSAFANTKPTHRAINSLDTHAAERIKTKQIMFYSELVNSNYLNPDPSSKGKKGDEKQDGNAQDEFLNKLFTVIDNTPATISLSICKERIKNDLTKIVMYEEELQALYTLIEKVSRFFEEIDFDHEIDFIHEGESIMHSSKLDPHSSKNRKNGGIPKMNPNAARQLYINQIKQKALDFSKIKSEYYHIKEMLIATQKHKLVSFRCFISVDYELFFK